MAQEHRHMTGEADIGSGEKTPGQADVQKDLRSVPDTKPGNSLDGRQEQRPLHASENGNAGRILQSGTHLARILAQRQPDETYEAQVYVRLTREPEVAETYIPAGIFPTENEAWAAAEERAKRAFREHEF